VKFVFDDSKRVFSFTEIFGSEFIDEQLSFKLCLFEKVIDLQ